ncbi:MAG: putative bifunctional diguanylate cyclase/phosphodiesterase [Clostridia bacterium]|jgi:diguanylate cyclase (GGDEF)-like protein
MLYNDSTDEAGNSWGMTPAIDRLALSRTLLSITRDGVFFMDSCFRIRYANPVFVKALNMNRQEHWACVDPTPPELSSPIKEAGSDGSHPGLHEIYTDVRNRANLANAQVALAAAGFWNGDLIRITPNGDSRVDEVTIALARQASGAMSNASETALRYVGVARDVSDERAAHERLAWTRNHDELTGLPNRALFTLATDQIIARTGEGSLALIVADLDDFKQYNTSRSHELGDRLLQETARRISATVRAGDMSARTAGDEFSVLMPIRAASEAREAAQRVAAAFSQAIQVDGECFALKASIGVAVWPADGNDASSLLAAADLAMQACKEKGRDGIMLYEEGLTLDRIGRRAMEKDLRSALDGNLLSVSYQPVVRVDSGAVESVEALVRWCDPERGDIAPDRFIPLAEETGLIMRLGEQVMLSACQQGLHWACPTGPSIKVAVNVSPIQLEHPGFTNFIARTLELTALPPERLVIEITESTLLEHMEDAAATLTSLKLLGVSISVDDFGTGYSSLAYLKNLPLDILKIDREFIKDLEGSEAGRDIVAGIINLAHRMGLSVVAEGVETAGQFGILRELKCDHAQGFLFSRAISPQEIESRYLALSGGSRLSAFLN